MTMKIKQIILVAASGILTGCGLLGPDYVKPQVNSATKNGVQMIKYSYRKH